MQIWIDGDACPKVTKDIVFRAAKREKTRVIIVSNHLVSIPKSLFIKHVLVTSGFNVADQYILDEMRENDLVITADIAFADAVINDKHGIALDPNGELYTANDIKQRLSIRNFNQILRESGIHSSGGAKLNNKNVQKFSNQLDRILHQRN